MSSRLGTPALKSKNRTRRPAWWIYWSRTASNLDSLVRGDKTGDDRFYEVMVPLAEKIWEQYLAEQAAGLHHEED